MLSRQHQNSEIRTCSLFRSSFSQHLLDPRLQGTNSLLRNDQDLCDLLLRRITLDHIRRLVQEDSQPRQPAPTDDHRNDLDPHLSPLCRCQDETGQFPRSSEDEGARIWR